MTKQASIFVLYALALAGCAKLPKLPGYHWHRGVIVDTLYDSKGSQVATVITGGPGAAQACVQHSPNGEDEGCTYWENDSQAYAEVERVFRVQR